MGIPDALRRFEGAQSRSEPWRVAAVGLGAVAEAHLSAYAQLEDVHVVGAVEPRADRRREVCARYGIPGFSTWEELLGSGRPDIACILTPASTHCELTLRCASAGVHVLCEKPMAITAREASLMARACAMANVEFFYGSSYRFLPAVARARELIAAGAIGEVRLVMEQIISGSGKERFKALSAAHYPEGGPGGGGFGLVDHGIHMLDVLPWLCEGRITSVFGRGDRSGAAPRVEFAILQMGSTIGFLTYDGCTWPADLPFEGLFSESRQWLDGRGWVGNIGEWECGAGNIRVHGSEGTLRIFHYANRLFLHRDGKWQEQLVLPQAAPAHFGKQLQHFCADLCSGRSASISAEDGMRALRALLAIYASEAAGHWEPVSASDEPN